MAACLCPGNTPSSRRKKRGGVPPLHEGGKGLRVLRIRRARALPLPIPGPQAGRGPLRFLDYPRGI